MWLNSEEFYDLQVSLQLTTEDVIDFYTQKVMNSWVLLKDQIVTSNNNNVNATNASDFTQCIFLGTDGKQCSIYEARPLQCRTYPWWPRLLMNQHEWAKESVVPDNIDLTIINQGIQGNSNLRRHWTAEEGGCEGIENQEAGLVPPHKINWNKELYELYHSTFPFFETGDDRNRLIAKVDLIDRVVKTTRRWVKEFVVGYNLCPFADKIFNSNRVRYRVFQGTDQNKDLLISKLRLEMLALLIEDEKDVETTLIMLPFAFNSFEVMKIELLSRSRITYINFKTMLGIS